MSLVYGASALCLYPENEEYLFAGVGAFLRIYKGTELFSEFEIFPSKYRIFNIIFQNNLLYVSAQDILRIIKFKNGNDFSEIESNTSIQFPDWVLTFLVKDEHNITAVLHHAQVSIVKDNEIVEEIKPKFWKIAVSAKLIDENTVLIGDSFGTISYYNIRTKKYFETNLDHGAIFDIDYDKETKKILAVQELHTVDMWLLEDSGFKLLMDSALHSSRVLRCCIAHNRIPVSLGEDGFMCVFDLENHMNIGSYHLHRTKIISAFCFGKDSVCSAGFDSNIRRFKMPIAKEPRIKQITGKEEHVVTACVYQDSYVICNNKNELLHISFNEDTNEKIETVLQTSERPFFLLQTNGNDLLVACSRSYDVVIIKDKNVIANVKIPRKSMPTSVSISNLAVFVVLSDITLLCYDLNGNLLLDTSISEYYKKPPIVSAADNNKPIFAIGGHSTRVTIFEFPDNFSQISKATRLDVVSNGFSQICFYGDRIYCAGKNDGIISILAKKSITNNEETTSEWVMKSSYQLPAGSKTNLGICASKDGHIVSAALSRDGVSFYDVNTQTQSGHIAFLHKTSAKLAYAFNSENNLIAIMWDANMIKMNSVSSIQGSIIGPSFHGLRGLCSAQVNRKYVLTGSCDRDIRCWSFTDKKPEIIDLVQSVDSGTHAISSDGVDIFTGGSQQVLFQWSFQDGKIFQTKTIDLTPFTEGGLCKRRVTAIQLTKNRVYVCMSDASLIVLNRADISLVQRYDLPGVAMSIDYHEESDTIACCTSTGSVWLINGEHIGQSDPAIRVCGFHTIKIVAIDGKLYILTSGDDGLIRFFLLSDDGTNVKVSLVRDYYPNHTGGVKSIDVLVKNDCFDIVSFSYDQHIHYVTMNKELSPTFETDLYTAVSHGESVNFIENGFVILGTGIQYFPFPN